MCIHRQNGSMDRDSVGLDKVIHVGTVAEIGHARKGDAVKIKIATVVALALTVVTSPAWAAGEEHIGTWTVGCRAGNQACGMRFSKRFIEQNGVTGDLEVNAQSGNLVPVIALRGLSQEAVSIAAAAGKTEATMQFGSAAPETLSCFGIEGGFVCTPSGGAASKLAALLPNAKAIKIKVGLSISGLSGLPSQEKTLDLAGTAQALAKLKTIGAPSVPKPALSTMVTQLTAQSALASLKSGGQPPSAIMAMADKMLKAAGYTGGVAALQEKLRKYLNRQR